MEKKKFKSNISNIRLDVYLQKQSNSSRSIIKQWISKKYVSINHNIVTKPSTLLTKGDTIICHIKEAPITNTLHKPSLTLDPIYEDTDIIIINKPSGILVHQGMNTNEQTIVTILHNNHIPLHNNGDHNRAGIVHRLDRLTEGLLVIAKSKLAFESLSQQFRDRTIKKRYYALLKGNLKQDIIVSQPITRHPKHRHKYCVCPTGRDALTRFFIQKRFNSTTLCNIELVSGRTHQIRVHAHFLGHPIIGDDIYSKTSRKTGQLLQAYQLSLDHPRLNKRLTFKLNISKRIKASYA